jgi:hypothetical protein
LGLSFMSWRLHEKCCKPIAWSGTNSKYFQK